MRKTYRSGKEGWSNYSLDNYIGFMELLRGAQVVTPLAITGIMPDQGAAVHHVVPEGVAISYRCREHSTGARNVELEYFGTKEGIRNLRGRVRRLEKEEDKHALKM